MNASTKLRFFKFWRIFKVGKIKSVPISKTKDIKKKKTEHMWKNSVVYVYKTSSWYLEKWPSFAVLKFEKACFDNIPWESYIFPILSYFVRHGPFKCVMVIFRDVDEELA